MTQLCEVEVCELKPKYEVEVMKWRCTSSTTLIEPEWLCIISLKDYKWSKVQVYMKDKRALIVAQRTCDKGVLNYVSNLETVRTKDEGVSQGYWDTKTKVPRGTWPGTQVYLSKAKLGIYSEYLGLYICFWDRGSCESEWSKCEIKYTVVRDMSQRRDKCGI